MTISKWLPVREGLMSRAITPYHVSLELRRKTETSLSIHPGWYLMALQDLRLARLHPKAF